MAPSSGTFACPCAPYTMHLSVVDCPLLPYAAELVPESYLQVEALDAPGVPISTVHVNQRVRAVLDVDVGDWLDPFLTDAVVCAVNPGHRLAGCATNEQVEGCPFRGCRGWSDDDSPLFSTYVYMEGSEWTAKSALDDVQFCKDKLRYDEGGCAAGACGWSVLPNRTALGGSDGFSFVVVDPPGTVLVVDVTARLELCSAQTNDTARAAV